MDHDVQGVYIGVGIPLATVWEPIYREIITLYHSAVWFCTRPRLQCAPNPAEADLTILKPNSIS